jgi:hypothetical protein
MQSGRSLPTKPTNMLPPFSGLNTDEMYSPEKSVITYQSTRCHNPKDRGYMYLLPQQCCHEEAYLPNMLNKAPPLFSRCSSEVNAGRPETTFCVVYLVVLANSAVRTVDGRCIRIWSIDGISIS